MICIKEEWEVRHIEREMESVLVVCDFGCSKRSRRRCDETSPIPAPRSKGKNTKKGV